MTGRPRERGWALARAADLLQLSRRHADCKSWAVGTAEGALPSHTFQANGSISRHWKNASTRPHTRILRLIYAHSARSAPLTAPCSTGASSDVASGLPRLGYGLDEGPVSKLSLLEGRKCLRTPKSVRGPIGKRWGVAARRGSTLGQKLSTASGLPPTRPAQDPSKRIGKWINAAASSSSSKFIRDDYSPWTALDVVRVSTRAMIRYL